MPSADNYPQPVQDANVGPTIPNSNAPSQANNQPPLASIDAYAEIFPDDMAMGRLNDYEYYSRLFLGNHFTAFNIRIDNMQYNRAYAKLRYVMVNFAGLISKILADMLFSEPVTIKVPDGDQDFIDALWYENNMDAQCYESALSNSYHGDAVFKLRIGKRYPKDKDSTVIIEDITPTIYFPDVDPFNVRGVPQSESLAWTFKKGNKTYLRKEIHTAGLLENKVYLMEGNKVMNEEPLDILGDMPGLVSSQLTRIDRSLIVHIPNWKTGNRFFGMSDYHDLDSLFYAINNRMTKVDNILDKHSDPILMVPPGVLDENGKVKKKALGVIEIGEGETGKPEYIVWDASLENAFKEIEKLVEFMYLTGEISPDILGMGTGVSDSGRALKFKLMRTIAKAARKKLYYDRGLKQVIYLAQQLAQAWNVQVGGLRLKKDPVVPEIDWQDGLPIDNGEQIDNEVKAIDAGITTKKDSIMRVYNIDEDSAEEMMKEIEEEKPKIVLPTANMNNFGKPNPADAGNGTLPNNDGGQK